VGTTIHVLISAVCSNKPVPFGSLQFRPDSEQVSTLWTDVCRLKSSLAFRFVSCSMCTVNTLHFKGKKH
jgi:hypothetical protein